MSDSTKSNHSAGPWRVDPSRRGFNDYIYGQHGRLIATAEIWETQENSEGHANAHLIAAAPEMFKELLWMAAQYDDSQTATTLAGRLYDVSATAKKLIALARGES